METTVIWALCVFVMFATAMGVPTFLLIKEIEKRQNLEAQYNQLMVWMNGIGSEIEEMKWVQNEFWFYMSSNYFDFLNHLHKHYHIADNKGKLTPFKPEWSNGEELKVIALGDWVRTEAKKRGLKFNKTQPQDVSD